MTKENQEGHVVPETIKKTETVAADQTSADHDTTMTSEEKTEEEEISEQQRQAEMTEDVAPEETLQEHKEDQETEEDQTPTSDNIFAGVSRKMFDQLTKKNQQFMVGLDRHLHGQLHYQVQEKAFKEITETLIEGQAQSQTAKQIYGTPTELAQVILNQGLHPENDNKVERSSDILLGIDGALFLGSLFTFVTGMSMMLRNSEVNGALVGLTSIIINYLLAGLSMLATAKTLPNPHAPKGKKGYAKYFIVSVLSMFAWFIVVSMSSVVLPRVINPVLSGYVYMIIGALTFALRFYVKRRYNIRGGVF